MATVLPSTFGQPTEAWTQLNAYGEPPSCVNQYRTATSARRTGWSEVLTTSSHGRAVAADAGVPAL